MEKTELRDSPQKQHGFADATVCLHAFPVLPASSKRDSILSNCRLCMSVLGTQPKDGL